MEFGSNENACNHKIMGSIMNYKITNLFLLFILNFVGCSPSNQTFDPSKNKQIAEEVGRYLYGCPNFFIPPVEGTDGTQKNLNGAVAWTPNGLTGDPQSTENKSSYIDRLNKATVANQTNWDQYKKVTGSGYPGYVTSSGTQVPGYKYQTGFVCYSLVYNAVRDAGFNPWPNFPLNCDSLKKKLYLIPDSSAVVGDIVFYDWDNLYNPTEFDHVGIIVGGTGSNLKEWKIVSSIGIVEIFNYGAKRTRLGVFGSTAYGGEFFNWPLENWTYKIYRVPTN